MVKNQKRAALTLGVLVLVAVGIIFFINHLDQRNLDAREGLFSGQQLLQEELDVLKASETKETKDNKKSENTAKDSTNWARKKLDVDQAFPKTVEKFTAVSNDFGGTRAGYDARMALGNLYVDHGETLKSVEWFKKASESAPGTWEEAMATYGMGISQEDLKQHEEAIATFKRGIGMAERMVNTDLKGLLLLATARNQRAAQLNNEARSTYDRVISEVPNSAHSKTAETLRAGLPTN